MVVILLGISVQQSYGYIPSRQAKFITFSNVNATEMTINWVRGNGQGVIVLVDDAAINVSGLGDNSSAGTADRDYTAGSTYSSTGAKMVYQGSAQNYVEVTNLAPGTTYHVAVLEYNVDGSSWDINNGTAVLNPRSKSTLTSTLPTGLSTLALTGTTATVQWTADGDGAYGYFIDVREFDGRVLDAYDLLDIGKPAPNKRFFISGLTGSRQYQWRLRPYDAQGRTGAATTWQPFTTLQTDPSVTITGAGSACAATASLIATWQTSTYYPQPATGTWTTLFYPTGASLPNSGAPNVVSAAGTSTWNVEVDTPGEYVFQYEISVGEYYSSTTAGYTFSAPWTNIITSSTSTCGEYIALSAETTGCAIGTGTWSYTGPGTGAFTSTSALSTEFELTGVTPTYGNYTFRWTSTAGGFESYDEIYVSFAEAATAAVTSSAGSTCGLTYTLDGIEPIASANGSWYLVSGPLGGVPSFNPDDETHNAEVTVNVEGYYSFAWKVSNDCASQEVGKHVTFYAEPTIATVGDINSTSTCGTGFYLTGNEADYGIGTWTVNPSVNVDFTNVNLHNSLVTVPTIVGGYDEYTFTWSIGNGDCPSTWDELTVTFYGQPVVDITTPSEATCGLSIQLDADEPAFGTGSWWLVSGPGTVEEWSSQSAHNATVTVSQAGEYSFAWTILNGDCEAVPAGKTVTFYAEPDLANAGNSTSTCGFVYTLSGNDPTSGASEGTWSGPVGSFSDVNAYNSTVTIPSFSGSSTYHTFTWSIGNGICDPETDDVTITFYNAPTTASAGSDVNSCGTLTGTFAGNTPLVGEGSWTMVSGAGNPSINNTSSPTSTFVVPAYGTYTFRWSIANGNCTTSTDDVVYNFYQTPIASVGNDFAVCSTQATLTGNNPSVGTGTWTVPSSVSLSSNTAYNAVATATAPGNYTMTWSVSNGTCDVVFDELTVSFKESPVAYAGTDEIACTGVDYYTMTGTWASLETGTWSASPNNPATASFSNLNDPVSNVWFTTPGTYHFTWTASNGTCTDTDEVTITVYDPIDIPEDAVINGEPEPVAGTQNVQYSIDDINDELTYSWYFTPVEGCGEGNEPFVDSDETNIVELDYALNACDGTLSVAMTDKCGNTTIVSLPIEIDNSPGIISSALSNTNAHIDITMTQPIYGDCDNAAVNASDFQLFFNRNGGTATAVSIGTITSQGSNVYRFALNITGTPNGCETIEIKPVAGAVVNDPCVAMPSDQTTGVVRLRNISPVVGSASGITPLPYANQANLTWSRPAGAKSLVVIADESDYAGFTDPTNYTTYPADASYGTASYAPGTGYVVYNGSGNSVDITGLDPEENYQVAIWVYSESCTEGENEYYNMTETTGSFGTGKLATKLVFTSYPTKITSGTSFPMTVQAQDDAGNAAYPGCDKEIYVHGSAAIATGTIAYNQHTVSLTGVFSDDDGYCNHEFTVDETNTGCGNNLTADTFSAPVAPTEPVSMAYKITFSSVGKNQMTVNWEVGTNPGTGRILTAKEGQSAFIPLTAMVDGTNYTPIETGYTSQTTSFTAGYNLGNDIKALYYTESTNAADNKATVQNLGTALYYNFRVFEFNKPEDCLNAWSLSNFKNSGSGWNNPRTGRTLTGKLGSFNGVEIAYFDGNSYQLRVDLDWEAISEDGIAYYEIYRQQVFSDDFVKVGSTNVNISAGASSKYTVTDDKGLALGETYIYRLVAVDFNGQSSDLAETTVTVTDEVNNDSDLTLGTVNPNPVKDMVKFDVSTTKLSPVLIQIHNAEGKVVYTEERMVIGNSTVEYRMGNNAAGSYIITITSGDQAAVTSFIYQP